MLYLAWFDDSKAPAATKIAAACAAYRARFGQCATVALVNETDAGAMVEGVTVRAVGRVGKWNYQVGRSE